MSILATELDWPEGTNFFEVQCRLGIWDVDGWDADKEPEVKTLGGTVRITPRTPAGRIRILEPDGKYRVVVTPPLTFAINEFTGKLVNTADNTEGVWVVDPSSDTVDPKDFTYSAVVTPKVGSPFTVEFDGSVAINGVYDLANGTTVAPSRGVSVLESRITKLEAELDDTTIITSSSYRITKAGDYVAGVDTTVTLDNGQSLSMKRGQALVAIDVAGQLFYSDFITLAGPKPPSLTPGELSATATQTEITATVTGATDSESGLHASPYRFSRDGGASWTPWQAGNSFTFTGLTAGVSYNLRAEVRNIAGDVATLSLAKSTQEDPNAWGTLYFDDFSDAADGDITGRAFGDTTWESGYVVNGEMSDPEPTTTGQRSVTFQFEAPGARQRYEFKLLSGFRDATRVLLGWDGQTNFAGEPNPAVKYWFVALDQSGCAVMEMANSGGSYPARTKLATGAGIVNGKWLSVVIEQDAGLVTLTIDGTQILQHQITDYTPSTHQRIEMWRRHQIDDFGYRFE